MKNPNPFDFHRKTPEPVRNVIEALYVTKERVRIFLGDSKTGTAWMEEYDVCGTIGKSTGTKPAPLLINNARSYGGPAILNHCIVKIIRTKDSKVLYENPKFNNPADRAVVEFADSPNVEQQADALGELNGWIIDRLNGINRLHRNSLTKKIRKAQGYNQC